MAELKLAIIGCGAITNGIHLPVSALSDQFEVTVLVDKSMSRARQLADRYDVPAVVDDYRDVFDKVDAAIVALPNYLHAPVTIDLLRHGIHVLVEKPMALKAGKCDEMIQVAKDAEVVLAVGMDCRFFESSRFVRQAFKDGLLGSITSFDLRQGSIFNWQVASDFMFRKDAAGGGVLVDMGVHALDLLLWWLGDYANVEYYDDARGGVEADCEVHLHMQCGARGIVALSRTRDLRNSWIFHGECGTLEVEVGYKPLITLKTSNQDLILAGHAMKDGRSDETVRDSFLRQLDDFAGAIRNGREPFVPGEEGRRAVKLIETCYRLRQPLKQPWDPPETQTVDVLEGASL